MSPIFPRPSGNRRKAPLRPDQSSRCSSECPALATKCRQPVWSGHSGRREQSAQISPGCEEPEANQSNVGFLADSFNDRFHDRLKALLLSNRESDIFEELNIHIVLARGFVSLHEFSQLYSKIRGFEIPLVPQEYPVCQQVRRPSRTGHAFCLYPILATAFLRRDIRVVAQAAYGEEAVRPITRLFLMSLCRF